MSKQGSAQGSGWRNLGEIWYNKETLHVRARKSQLRGDIPTQTIEQRRERCM